MAGGAPLAVPVRVGIIGCGSASELYLATASRISLLQVVACADVLPARAQRASARFGVPSAVPVDRLLSDRAVELVVNLTPPREHASVTRAALEAGKAVYSEKPLALSLRDGLALAALAGELGLVLACAPDTVLGAAVQSGRAAVERGLLGEPFAACAFDVSGGHEAWHPDAAFYYQAGGGPLLDLGPYHLTALVHLLGPVHRVHGVTRAARPERRLGPGPDARRVAVEVPTHVAALVEFRTGPVLTLGLSFDVGASALPSLEVYGSEGTLSLPDPSQGGGTARFHPREAAGWSAVPATAGFQGEVGKGVGLVDAACAMRFSSQLRVNAELALHVLEVMEAVLRSAAEGAPVTVTTAPSPPPLLPSLPVAELAGPAAGWLHRYLAQSPGA